MALIVASMVSACAATGGTASNAGEAGPDPPITPAVTTIPTPADAANPAESGKIVYVGAMPPVISAAGGHLRVVWISTEYLGAAQGGTRYAKCSGNYAGAFAAQVDAVAKGCDQVAWLDAVERRWVEELGGMNLIFVYGSGSSTWW